MHADDWPQWRGPRRDGISRETGLLKQWPAGGPRKLWSVKGLGKGYSTVSVVKGTIFTTGVFGKEGKLIAIRDGRILGTTSYGPDASNDRNYPGARSTPTVTPDRIFLMTGFGVVNCFDRAKGRLKWQVDTFKTFGGRQIGWQISESLLIDNGRVICTPGGTKALLAALDVRNGKTLWTTHGLDCKSAYCSPIAVTYNGRRIIITMVEYGLVGIDAMSGRLLWKHPHKNKYAVHAVTPIFDRGRIFITSGYGKGSELLKLSPKGDAIRSVWQQKELDNHHGGVVLYKGFIYGTNSRGLLCLDMRTGQVMSRLRAVGKGSLTMADDLLYVYGERGKMSLVDPNPKNCTLISSFPIKEGTGQHWSHPVVSDGVLYIRHGDVLMAYDVKAR